MCKLSFWEEGGRYWFCGEWSGRFLTIKGSESTFELIILARSPSHILFYPWPPSIFHCHCLETCRPCPPRRARLPCAECCCQSYHVAQLSAIISSVPSSITWPADLLIMWQCDSCPFNSSYYSLNMQMLIHTRAKFGQYLSRPGDFGTLFEIVMRWPLTSGFKQDSLQNKLSELLNSCITACLSNPLGHTLSIALFLCRVLHTPGHHGGGGS